MAKAKRVANVKVSFRMSEAVYAEVQRLAERTGWSESKAAAFLIETASHTAAHTDPKAAAKLIADAREEVAAAVALQSARAKADKLVKDAAKEFAAASAKRKGEKPPADVLESVPNTAKAVAKAAKADKAKAGDKPKGGDTPAPVAAPVESLSTPTLTAP